MVFVVDVFTESFDPQVALAAIGLARKLGLRPYLSAPHRNGKPLHVHGYLAGFEKAAMATARYLNALADLDVTLVGLDPSMTLVFRSEYQSLRGLGQMPDVLLPKEWLLRQLPRLRMQSSASATKTLRLMIHCTERTNAAASVNAWRDVFGALECALRIEDVGCCGMAGTFGHEMRNRPVAERLYKMSWEPVIDSAAADEVLKATGYSCHSQAKLMSGRILPHPLQVFENLLS